MAYAPDRGDVIWITFNTQAGHEQAGRRPALVLSPVASQSWTRGVVPNNESSERLSVRGADTPAD
jgi:mRNA interferase MazF